MYFVRRGCIGLIHRLQRYSDLISCMMVGAELYVAISKIKKELKKLGYQRYYPRCSNLYRDAVFDAKKSKAI